MPSSTEGSINVKARKKIRATKKGNMTRVATELKEGLAKSHPTAEDLDGIKARRAAYKVAYEELKLAHTEYVEGLTEEEDLEEAEMYINSIVQIANSLTDEVDNWLAFHEDPLKPSDSVSHVGSNVSTTSSARAHAAAKKASLLAKASMLKEHQELQLKELQVSQQMEQLSVRTELAMAEAEERAYDEAVSLEESVPSVGKSVLATVSSVIPSVTFTTVPAAASSSSLPAVVSSVVPAAASSVIPGATFSTAPGTVSSVIPAAAPSSLPAVVSSVVPAAYSSSFPAAASSSLPAVVSSVVPAAYSSSFPAATSSSIPAVTSSADPATVSCPVPAALSNPVQDPVSQMIQKQQNQLLEAIHLPKAELMYFDGDPLKYWSFIKAFQNSVDDSNLSENAKLMRLLQYCKGNAAKVIQCCAVMTPKEGYVRALSMLKERFGDNHLIAEAWLERVTNRAAISPYDKQGIRDYADDLKCCKETLESMGYLQEMSNQRVLVVIAERLPSYLRSRWVREVRRIRKQGGRIPSIGELVEFVSDAAEEANDPVYGRLNARAKEGGYHSPKSDVTGTGTKSRAKGSNFNLVVEGNQVDCLKCKQSGHSLLGCSEFKSMSPGERSDFARNNRLCFNCLKPGHRAGSCKLNRTCDVQGCGKKHTRYLHQTPNVTKPAGDRGQSAADESVVHSGFTVESSCAVNGAGATKVALPIVAVNVFAGGGSRCVKTYALLDTGSTSSFCSEKLVSKLGVMGQGQTLSLTTLNGKQCVAETNVVSLRVASIDNGQSIQIPVVYSQPEIPIREENIVKVKDLKGWSHLCDLELPQVKPDMVELLIGQDCPEALTPLEVRMGQPGDPYATRTKLGWAVSGPMGHTQGHYATAHFICNDVGLEQQLEKFWKIDSNEMLGQDIREMSIEDKRAISVWEDSICLKDGHYELAIPFRKLPLDLPDNRKVADQRLQSLGKRLKQDPVLFDKYCKGMDEVLSKGYAHKVPENELHGKEGSVWYLPHHPVTHPAKPDKVRIVYDCASKHSGTSLNDKVLQGPDLNNKLLGVLLRFRDGRIALMSDIESMFHQVRVTPGNRDVLRFLWWGDGDLSVEPQVYRMAVHLFGGSWSPSCCSFALQQTADDNVQAFSSDTVNTVRQNFYVDDCLRATDDENSAVRLYHELSELLQRGGFRLTNSLHVLRYIPDEDRAETVKGLEFNQKALPVERALGVYWNVSEDNFGYKFSLQNKPLTRRGLLSTTSSVYDPLGFACPFTIKAKMVIQDLCRLKLGWDDPLPLLQLQQWLCWKQDLPKLDDFRVGRCFNPGGRSMSNRYELHYFSDASEAAYGAVSYLRIVHSDGTVHCGIMMAKAHLAPLKQMTIPRLELTAATLSVKLDSVVRRELEIPIHASTFWTDSTIVLHYIHSQEKRFKTFVANRISVILDGSSPSQWHHVPTSLNPADAASRGLTAGELVNMKMWVRGPEYLWGSEENWPQGPKELPVVDLDPEVKKVKVDSYHTNNEGPNVMHMLLGRRSDWSELLRDVGWLLRYKHYLRAKGTKELTCDVSPTLSVDELKLAERAIVKYIQCQSFGNCIVGDVGIVVKKSNPLYKLDPQLSDSGVLCVGGRLSNAPIEEDMKHPMILPKGGHVVTLIIRHIHEQHGHVGREHVLAILRERFWVVGARSIVRRVLRNCFTCKRATAPQAQQKMADLPYDRVKPDMPPFSYVGVDYFGPFKVRRGRSEVKRYGCLFTCLVVRAIHIEVAHTLDTDSFINALQRFIARRGEPVEIRSDNGSNFVGAERELRETINSWNQQKIEHFMQRKMIQWKFNTPLASHMGGVWERLIRSTRKVMCSITREQVLDDERLSTLLCLVESVVNGRPLTYLSSDVKDPEPLTPNHLLLLRQGSTFPVDVFDKKDMYCKRRWRQVQYLAGVFWHRWIREYLVLLQQRQKWVSPERNLRPGDIVLVVDEDLPRNKWVLGRIVETYPGKDNLVRSVEVKTKDAILVRPVRKLCLLETVQQTKSNDS